MNTLFQKLICSTLLLSVGQSMVAAELSTLQPLTSRMYTSVTNHISNHPYTYGAPLAAVAGIIALKTMRDYSRQCFLKRREALENLGFPTSATRMAKRMSMEQVETLRDLLKAGVPLDDAKRLNKEHSKNIIENIVLLVEDGYITLNAAISYAKQYSADREVLLTRPLLKP
ncbi:MAG TPA: hypothetical protein VGT41_03040 [Candidatus Babeliales bacterium]|nr:hypothetical protein [Candidatus Babeliales bacterium]